jgi:hypothetical protein
VRDFKALERASNVAVIVAAVVLIFAVFFRRGSEGRNADRPTRGQLESKLRGEVVSNPEFLPGSNPFSCVLALSTHCPFCEQNVAFYQKISTRRPSNNFQLVGAFPQPQSEAVEYLRKRGIAADRVISLSLGDLRVEATPTILLIGQQGQTIGAWVGALDQARQNEVLEMLSKLETHSQ